MADPRYLHLRGALGAVRTEMWNGREHLVVPCVALQEGIIHAINAPSHEFVPSSTLLKSFEKWQGHPLVVGHPVRDGKQVSAHDPAVLEQHGFGLIRHGKMNGSRLGLEALVDPARLEQLGQQQLLKDLREGKPIEVSVGAFVTTSATPGSYNGRSYATQWEEITPDHLAFLPKGTGACSLAAGCGANRMASTYLVTAEGFEPVQKKELEGSMKPRSLRERLVGLLTSKIPEDELERMLTDKDCDMCKGTGSKDGNPCEVCDGNGYFKAASSDECPDCDGTGQIDGQECPTCGGTGDADEPDDEARALKGGPAICPTCAGAGKVDEKDCADCEGSGKLRTAVGARNSAADLKQIQDMHDRSVTLGASCTTKSVEIQTLSAAEQLDQDLLHKAAAGEAAFRAACGCQGDTTMTPEAKTEIIKALVADKHSGFTAGDEKMLEAASDARLESFRVAAESRAATEKDLRAAAERKLTAEEFMAVAPPELRSLITRQQTQETNLKAELITQLKAAQSEYSEAELSVMPVADLSRMARMAKVEVRVDYTGKGLPRVLSGDEEDYAAPNPYDKQIAALQAARH